jgi:hypothetical protein
MLMLICFVYLACETLYMHEVSQTHEQFLSFASLLLQVPPTAVIAARLLRTVAADVHSRAAAAGLEPLLQPQYAANSSKSDSHVLLPPPPPLMHSTTQHSAVLSILWGSGNDSSSSDTGGDSIQERLQAARAAHGEALRATLRRCDAHMLHEPHWL